MLAAAKLLASTSKKLLHISNRFTRKMSHSVPDAQHRELYPEIEPFNSGMLKVSDVHEIYYEECGNPAGKPAVFVHGGPGGGCDSKQRRFFNPDKYRVILFDQRGCGRSTPHASLEDNTTWHLVSDMERIREHLGLERWLVFGGSWGSTLALAYAQKHPERVTELILRGIFLLREHEIKWFYQFGAHHIFPDAWDKYVAPIPEEERHDFVKAFYKRLTSEDAAVRAEAAKAWSIWEGMTSYLYTDPKALERFGDDKFADAFARIECHYFTNKGFFDYDGQLLAEVHKIKHIPAVIVQGRYDVVCPMTSAWDLHKAWPEAELHITPDAGHSQWEPGNMSKLLDACDKFADQ